MLRTRSTIDAWCIRNATLMCVAALALMLANSGATRAADGTNCELPSGARSARSADRAAGTALAYRFEPADLRIDRHFSLLIDTCPATSTATLIVDALMPAHRHGMNYKPKVTQLAPGRWRAEGLLLHMPGDWEFRFDIREAGRTVRLVDTIAVE